MAIIFVKYRPRFAWGDSSWKYETFGADITDDSLKDAMEEIASEYDYSDKFRGMEWERCEPTPEVLDGFIRGAENAVVAAQNRLLALQTYKVELNEADDDIVNTPGMN